MQRNSISVALEDEDVEQLDARVAQLRARGLSSSSRSSLIRVALESLDFPRLLESVRDAAANKEETDARPAVIAGACVEYDGATCPNAGERTEPDLAHPCPGPASAPSSAPHALHPDESATAEESPGPAAEPLSREARRSRRKREVRAKVMSVRRMTKRELELGRLLYPGDDEDPPRPKRRLDCLNAERPCPYVSCKHHLYLDVSPRTGAIKFNFPDLEVHEMAQSCALDVADEGGATLERVGEIMNLTRERIRQIEHKGMDAAEKHDDVIDLGDAYDLERKPRDGRPSVHARTAGATSERLRLLNEQGLCNRCGHTPARPNRRTCAECAEDNRQKRIAKERRAMELLGERPLASDPGWSSRQ